jgi:GGDEF domain-containing protein
MRFSALRWAGRAAATGRVLAFAALRVLGRAGVVVAALSLAAAVHAAPTMPASGRMALDDQSARGLIDDSGTIGAQAVFVRGDWQALAARDAWPAQPAAVWMRLAALRTPGGADAVLVVPRSNLLHASVHWRDAGGTWQSSVAGEDVDIARWALPAAQVALPVDAAALARGEVLLRMQHATRFADRPALWTHSAWHDRQALDHLAFGLFLGVALMALLYALAEGLRHRDVVTIWYGAHVLAMAAVVATQLGYGRVFLESGDTIVAHAAPLGLAVLLATVTLLFVRRALPTAFGGELASQVSLGVAMAGPLLAGVYAFDPAAVDAEPWRSLRYLYYVLVFGCVIALLWAARGVRLPQRWWYRAAFAAAAFALVPTLLHALGRVPGSDFVRYALPLGVAVEFALLTYALSLSSRLVLETGATSDEPRTIDRSTGFIHASELPAMLVGMALRASRVKQPGSVVLLHLSNLDDLVAEFGTSVAAAAESAAARTIRLSLRPGDQVVRLDATQYVVLLHRVHGPEEARAFFAQVQAFGLQHCPELPAFQQIQWHAAIGHLPQHTQGNPERLPQRLKQLVQQIRHGSASHMRELPAA